VFRDDTRRTGSAAPASRIKQRIQSAWWNVLQFYVLYLVCIFFRCAHCIFAAAFQAHPRVIVAEPFGMGDVIALEPLVANLRQGGWEVTFLGQERWRPIMSDVAWIGVPKPWPEMGVLGFVRFACKLARTRNSEYRGTTGVDPRGDIRSILILLLLGCKNVITLDYYEGLKLKIPPGIAKRNVHASSSTMQWELALQFSQALGIQHQAKRPPQVEHLRGNVQAKSKQVGIIPVAPWAGKRWVAEKWSEVICELRKSGFDPVIICGPGQEREAIVAIGMEGIRVLGAKCIPDLAEKIAGCEVIITVDSGPMHLASALNVPLVALYGTGQLPRWAPFSRNARVVTSPTFWQNMADPVNVHPIERNASLGQYAMSQISSESVIRAFREVLNQVDSLSLEEQSAL